MSNRALMCRLLVAGALAAGGCASSTRVAGVAVDPARAYQAIYGGRAPAPGAAPRTDVAPRLTVASTNRVGVRNRGDNESRFVAFDVADRAGAPEIDALLAGYRQREGTRMVVWYRGFGDTVPAALQRHLGRYFARAAVMRGAPADAATAPVHVEVGLELGPLSYAKRTVVELRATLPDGETVAVRGRGSRNSAVHLAWALPLGRVSFPLGFAIASSIMAGINTRYMAESCAQAIDDAAAHLAAELATRWRATVAVRDAR